MRCCDIIRSNYAEGCVNILFTYDVKIEKQSEFQRFDSNSVYSSYFDKIVNMARYSLPSVKNFAKLYKFCKERRRDYDIYANTCKDADTIYFFADNELEIVLLVGLIKEKANPSLLCILVDEGLVTYSKTDHKQSWKIMIWMKLFTVVTNLKYFNLYFSYGSSNLYNLSLANYPERAIYFHNPVKYLPPLSEELCMNIREKIRDKNVPDYNYPYYIHIGTYEKSFFDDIPVIREIQSILKAIGVKFYIKLHPQQNESLYQEYFEEGVILEKGYPVELFMGHNSLIGGTISSSLLNASLQGYSAIDISGLYPIEKRKAWVQMPITEQFEWINIYSANSYNQFKSIVYSFLQTLEGNI